MTPHLHTEQMLQNMDQFALLPPETLVFCAHEYTESNYKFLASVDPEKLQSKYEEIKGLCNYDNIVVY